MIYITKTYLPDKERFKTYVDKIYHSGWITNNGQMVRELEERLKEYLGVKNIVLVSNGTLALQLAYKSLELKGEVITTPFSFVATTSSLIWQGLEPVFVDIDSETLNIDVNKIESAISEKTSCIVPVHVFGNVCDVEKIGAIARAHNISVIYDAAHAFGVKYKGKSVLNYGDISILSLHATKLFHTIEGGAIITNDDKLCEKIRLMINFGIADTENIKTLGINAKMNEFQAAMGLCVLEDIDYIIQKRKQIHAYYKDNLPPALTYQKHHCHSELNYAYFPIIFEDENTLLRVKNNLIKRGILPRRYFYPSLDKLPYVHAIVEVSVAVNISTKILCIPIYPSLKLEEQKQIINAIKASI